MSGCATRNDQLCIRYEMLQSLHNLITAFMLLANSTHKYIDKYDVSSVKVMQRPQQLILSSARAHKDVASSVMCCI